MADELDLLINKYSPSEGDSYASDDIDSLVDKYSSPPSAMDMISGGVGSPLSAIASPTTQASPEALDPAMESLFGIPAEVLSGQASLSGGLGLRALAEAGLKATPIGRLPLVPSAVRTLATLIGTAGGNAAGDEIRSASSSLIKGKPSEYEFGKAIAAKSPTTHAVEGIASIAADKFFKSYFGDMGKTSASMKNDAAENFAHVLGIQAKDLKHVRLDDKAQEAIPEIYDDIINIARDGAVNTTKQKNIQYDVIKKGEDLISDVDKHISLADKELDTKTIFTATKDKLTEVREWAKEKYKDTSLRNEAISLIDEAEESITKKPTVTWEEDIYSTAEATRKVTPPEEEISLGYVNRLKRNYYSDKVSYEHTKSASKVGNETTKKIAHALKESVEELYDATKHGKNNTSVAKLNNLASSYIAIRKAIEGPLATLRVDRVLPMGIQAQNALMGGAMTKAAMSGAIDPATAAVTGAIMLPGMSKSAPMQRVMGEGRLAMSDALGAGDDLLQSLPPSLKNIMQQVGHGASTYGAEQVGDFTSPVGPPAEMLLDIAGKVGKAIIPGATPAHAEPAEEVKIPRDVAELFDIAPNELPLELQTHKAFQDLMTEGIEATDENRRALFKEFAAQNRDLVSSYFEQSPIRGFSSVVKDGNGWHMEDEYERTSYRQQIENSNEPLLTKAKRIKALNASNRVYLPGDSLDEEEVAPQASKGTTPKKGVKVKSTQGGAERQKYDY